MEDRAVVWRLQDASPLSGTIIFLVPWRDVKWTLSFSFLFVSFYLRFPSSRVLSLRCLAPSARRCVHPTSGRSFIARLFLPSPWSRRNQAQFAMLAEQQHWPEWGSQASRTLSERVQRTSTVCSELHCSASAGWFTPLSPILSSLRCILYLQIFIN